MAAFTPRDLESIRAEVAQFAAERDWDQFHNPRSLLLAVLSELGEAADVIRWQQDGDGIPPDRRADWDDELADAFTLLVRLADRSGTDLPAAFARKLDRARAKYPVDAFKGSNRKYDR